MALDNDALQSIQQQIESISVVSHERAVLANILHESDLIYETQLQLEPPDFSNHINKNIYSIMLEIADGKYETVTKITPFVILMIAKTAGLEAGGEEYLKALEITRANKENFQYSIDKVKLASIKRHTAYEGINVIEDCLTSGDCSIDEFTAKQETRFVDITLTSQGVDQVHQIGEDVEDDLTEYEQNEGEIEGYQTGFTELDVETGGLVPGELTVLGAFAKTGKSAYLLNVAKHLTVDLEEPVPVLYIDTEMTTKKQRSRLLSIMSGVREKTIRRGLHKYEPDLDAKVKMAGQVIKKIPLYHVHVTDFTMDKIINLVRKYKKKYGIKVVIFDYIKLPDNANGKFQEYQELGIITSALKNKIASKMDLAVLTAGQLNRSGSDEKNLNANNLGGSLKILQFCDNLLFLRNKTQEEITEDGNDNGNQILSLGYARNGGDYLGWIDYKKHILTMKELKNISIKIAS